MNRQAEEQAEMAEQLHAQLFTPPEATEETVTPEVEIEPEVVEPEIDYVEELRKANERYAHLKGKYDAEVPRLHGEFKEFKQTVFEKLEAQAKSKEVETPPEDKFAKFREEYGDELYEAIRELSSMTAEEKLRSSLAPVQEQVTSVEDAQIKAAKHNFVNYLDGQVKGDWKKLWSGEDAGFIEFLQQPDPSGLYTYGQLVEAYNNKWDADRLGKVFNTYLESQAPTQAPQARPERQAMVAPSRQNTHSTPSIDAPRIWTAQTMKEFQEADRTGKYTPEESKAMWDDLLSAPSQNRMR